MSEILFVTTKDFFVEIYTLMSPQNHMHHHHSYEIYYILDGEREYFIGDKFFNVSSGDLVWVPKDMLHRTCGKGATRFLIYFTDSFIQKYLSEEAAERLLCKEPFVFRPENKVESEFRNMFYELLKEYEKGDSDYDEFIINRIMADLLYFIYSQKNYYKEISVKPNLRMHHIVKYINDHYSEDICMQDMANMFGVTKNHFCHVFSRYMGVTFITYLNTVRIKAACDLLKKDSDSILDVSNKCGFCSSHYFYKVFKEEKGMSPSEYRAKFRTEYKF